MNDVPRISEAEWEVMKAVWHGAPCTAEEIIERLSQSDESWHPKTARTLLNRLIKKKALAFEKDGRAYLYRPLVSERDCVAAASDSFLDRVFGGALKPMIAHFVQDKKLTAKEVQELRDLLKDLEK